MDAKVFAVLALVLTALCLGHGECARPGSGLCAGRGALLPHADLVRAALLCFALLWRLRLPDLQGTLPQDAAFLTLLLQSQLHRGFTFCSGNFERSRGIAGCQRAKPRVRTHLTRRGKGLCS